MKIQNENHRGGAIALAMTLLLTLCVFMMPSTGKCQSSAGTGTTYGSYSTANLYLPWVTLPAGMNTNTVNGFTNTTYFTNITITYSPSTSAYVTNTIITTNNAVRTPVISLNQIKDQAISSTVSATGSGTNLLIFAPSIDGTLATMDLTRTFSFSNTFLAAANNQVASLNLSAVNIGGFGYITLLSNMWTSASGVLTNGYAATGSTNAPDQTYGAVYGIKKGVR